MSPEKMNIKRSFLIFLFALLFSGEASFAQSASISVSDTVAGEDVEVRGSGFLAREEVDLQLIRPGLATLSFPAQADEWGTFRASIFGFHAEKDGSYQVLSQRDVGEVLASFAVYPGPVSAYRSEVLISDPSVAADGEAESRFKILLRDSFGNPVPQQKVQVLSSRNEDVITTQRVSDRQGEIRGKIVSQTPGVSHLSVLSGDTVLFQKSEVVFYLPESLLSNVGTGDQGFGSFLKAQLFDEEKISTVAYFSVENQSGEVSVDKNLTIKVIAKDKDGNKDPYFRGTVRFSSSDDRADLPADYQFTESDQGEHTFFLAVTFQTPGSQTLAVHNLGDFRISGEISTNVTLGNNNVDIPRPSGSLTILTPRPGTFRSSRMTITGEAVGIQTVEIRDGDRILASDVPVDSSGNFVYQTPGLGDGMHVFTVAGGGKTSNSVTVKIDRTPPNEVFVRAAPSQNLAPSSQFQLHVMANEPLSSAKVVFQGVLSELQPSGDGFTGQFTSPLSPGVYPVDVLASDLLGNETEKKDALSLAVGDAEFLTINRIRDGNGNLSGGENLNPSNPSGLGGEGSGNGGVSGGGGLLPGQIDDIAPTAVSNVSAQSGDGKITLFWSPAKDNGEVGSYRIEFGSIDLSDVGSGSIAESLGGSDEPSGLHSSGGRIKIGQGPEGEDSGNLGDGDDFLLPTEDGGGALGEDGGAGDNSHGEIIGSGGEQVSLDGMNVTPDNRTQWYVDDLEDGKKYFFRVVAVDSQGNESPASDIIEAVTAGTQELMHDSAPESLEESGTPSSKMPFVLAILAGCGVLVLSRRRRTI